MSFKEDIEKAKRLNELAEEQAVKFGLDIALEEIEKDPAWLDREENAKLFESLIGKLEKIIADRDADPE